LDLTLTEFEAERERILAAVSAVAGVHPECTIVLSVVVGSLLVTVAVPDAAASKLLHPASFHMLQELLAPVALMAIDDASEARAKAVFTEASTVENLIRDLLCGGVIHHTSVAPGLARSSGKLAGLGW